MLPDGRVAYLLRKPRRNGATHLVMRASAIFGVDVLACPCGGRRAIVGDISDREVVVAILAHLGLPPFAPLMARARSPSFDVA